MSTTEDEEETTNAEVGMKCNDLVISEEYISPVSKEAISDDETLNSGGSQYNKDECCLTDNGSVYIFKVMAVILYRICHCRG